MLKLKNKRKFKKIILTDCEGNSETFTKISDVAEYCDVKAVSVYNAIRRNFKLCGCVVKVED